MPHIPGTPAPDPPAVRRWRLVWRALRLAAERDAAEQHHADAVPADAAPANPPQQCRPP